KERAERFAVNHSANVDSNWIQTVADLGRQIYAEKISVPSYIVARTQVSGRILGRIIERYSDDSEKLEQMVAAFQRLSTFETDIILAQVSLLETMDAANGRGRESEQ